MGRQSEQHSERSPGYVSFKRRYEAKSSLTTVLRPRSTKSVMLAPVKSFW